MTTYLTKCGECKNYHSTGNEIGTCSIKRANVSKHRPTDECTDWSRRDTKKPLDEKLSEELRPDTIMAGSMRITSEVIRRWTIAIPEGPVSPEASATIAVNVNRGCTINSITVNKDGEIEIVLELKEESINEND